MTENIGSLREIITKIRKELGASMAMDILADMIIISEVWREDGILHIIAWVPDIDPVKRSFVYKRKHILYNESVGKIIEIRDETAKRLVPA